jgi:methionyl-tRNA formyltransferase
MGVKIAFFCGHKSPYGLAHLTPLINEFDVKVVIIGTEERWKIFHRNLGGKVYYEPRRDNYLFLVVKIVVRWVVKLLAAYRKLKDVRQLLRFRHIELWEIFDVNSENAIQRFKELDVDLFISAAYPQIFSKYVLDIPKLGAVNFHPALLPAYRGAHPHFWQIVNGEREGGITAHFMTESIDDGDIIAQLSFPIEDCTYLELYEMIIKHTHQLVREVQIFFEMQTTQARPQRAEDATYYRNDREIHGRVFWHIHTSEEIYNLIRTGRAFCFFKGKKVIFASSYKTKSNRNLTNGVRVESGTIVDVGKDSVSVKTIDGCINIKEIKKGRKNLSFLQWAKVMNISIGEKFD